MTRRLVLRQHRLVGEADERDKGLGEPGALGRGVLQHPDGQVAPAVVDPGRPVLPVVDGSPRRRRGVVLSVAGNR